LTFEFQPKPESIEGGAEELPKAEVEAAYKIPVALVVLAEHPPLATVPPHGGEAAVIKTHEAKKWACFFR
jgi:hypothetical protein